MEEKAGRRTAGKADVHVVGWRVPGSKGRRWRNHRGGQEGRLGNKDGEEEARGGAMEQEKH